MVEFQKGDQENCNRRLLAITAITKGLIALLLQVLSGQPGQAIAAAELYFMEAIGMHALIGFQRSSGLAHMIKTIKLKAVARLAQTAPCCHTC